MYREDLENSNYEKLEDYSLAIPSLLVLVMILLMSDVHPQAALKIVLVVVMQTFVGLLVSGYQLKTEIKLEAKNIFLAFFYGTIIHIILDQVFRATGFREYVPLVFAGIVVMSKRRELSLYVRRWKSKHEMRPKFNRYKVHFSILLLALLPLSQVWSWTRNSILVLLIAFLLYATNYFIFKTRLYAVLTALLVAGVSQIRPSYWWLPGWGIDEVTIYTRAVYNWGPKCDVLLAGIPFKYQWLGFSWMGLMEHLSSARDYEFVSRTAYIICVFAAVFAIFAISSEIIGEYRKSIIATFIVVTFSTAISYPVNYSLISINYQHFAVVTILAWILILIQWMKIPTIRKSIELSIVGVICIASKSVHVVPIIVVITSVAGLFLLHRNSKMLFGACLNFCLSLIYVQIGFPSQEGTGLKRVFADFTREFGVAPEVNSIRSRVFMAIVVIAGLSTAALLSMFLPTKSMVLRFLRIPILINATIAILLPMFFSRVSATELHFLQVTILICLILFASSLAEWIESFCNQLNLRILIKLLLVTAMPLMYFSLDASIDDAYLVLRIVQANFAAALVAMIFALLLGLSRVNKWSKSFQMAKVFALALTSISLINFVINTTTRDLRPINRVGATYQLGQSNLQEAAKWINSNTPIETVVASNQFFGEGQVDNCNVTESYLMDSTANQVLNTNYYTSVLLIQRRFLVAGVQYAAISYDGSVLPRVRASLRPACFPDVQSKVTLQKMKVNYYIAYRTEYQNFNYWSELGRVLFQNANYTIINIDQTENSYS